jgi:threonine dehydrogenase-like Zn-dependent dehydrogenase
MRSEEQMSGIIESSETNWTTEMQSGHERDSVHRYVRPLMEKIARGEIDPTFVISHRLELDDAPEGYAMFVEKEDDCTKIVLKP